MQATSEPLLQLLKKITINVDFSAFEFEEISTLSQDYTFFRVLAFEYLEIPSSIKEVGTYAFLGNSFRTKWSLKGNT